MSSVRGPRPLLALSWRKKKGSGRMGAKSTSHRSETPWNLGWKNRTPANIYVYIYIYISFLAWLVENKGNQPKKQKGELILVGRNEGSPVNAVSNTGFPRCQSGGTWVSQPSTGVACGAIVPSNLEACYPFLPSNEPIVSSC